MDEKSHMVQKPNRYSLLKFLPTDIRGIINLNLHTANEDLSLIEHIFAALKTKSYQILDDLLKELMKPGVFNATDPKKDATERTQAIKTLAEKIVADTTTYQNATSRINKLPEDLKGWIYQSNMINSNPSHTVLLFMALKNNWHTQLETILSGQNPDEVSIPLDKTTNQICSDEVFLNTITSNPLIIAAQCGHIECIQELLRLGASINLTDSLEKTAMHYASIFGHELIIDFLLQQPGIDIEMGDRERKTPLWNATDNGHINIIQKFIQARANVNNADHFNTAPLSLAIKYGDQEAADLLLKNNADIEAQSTEGFTPFLVAAYYGRTEMLCFLNSKGAQNNAVDTQGCSALTLAASKGHLTTIRSLIQNGADINKKNNCGNTPLMELSENMLAFDDNNPKQDMPRIVACAQLLIENGADINSQNNKGNTALMIAIKEKSFNFAQFLIKNGAKLLIKNNKNKNCLDKLFKSDLEQTLPYAQSYTDDLERFSKEITPRMELLCVAIEYARTNNTDELSQLHEQIAHILESEITTEPIAIISNRIRRDLYTKLLANVSGDTIKKQLFNRINTCGYLPYITSPYSHTATTATLHNPSGFLMPSRTTCIRVGILAASATVLGYAAWRNKNITAKGLTTLSNSVLSSVKNNPGKTLYFTGTTCGFLMGLAAGSAMQY